MAQVKIGTVWEDTTDVLVGRSGLLAPVAGIAFFLPAVARAAVKAYQTSSPGWAALALVVALVALVATLWGFLAIVAISSDPATTRADATRVARDRLPKSLLVTLVLIAIAVLAFLPIPLVLWSTGFDFQSFAANMGTPSQPRMTPGAARFVGLYGLLITIAGLWLSSRLFLLNPVIANENRGIGALGRSVALTRGMTWKLIGVALLYAVVASVAGWAVRAVVYIVFRLLLGADAAATATFLGLIAAGAVAAAFSTGLAVFGARLYAAVRKRDMAMPA